MDLMRVVRRRTGVNKLITTAGRCGGGATLWLLLGLIATSVSGQSNDRPEAAAWDLKVRRLVPRGQAWERQVSNTAWDPKRTAVIVCDVWDYHHCYNAVQRLDEMLPRMEALLTAARQRGAIIIHAPSDCMPSYVNHPARQRAQEMLAERLPTESGSWNCKLPTEDGTYPLDQSDGGEDDDPEAHADWERQLAALGRDPALPWKFQNPKLTIDPDRDYISDRGDEIWSILNSRQVDKVVMIGVHTNMCVLGRPFGLRQMVKHGKQVVLVRDLTDCMYNPQRWPYVDHYSGNDLIVSYVEQYICGTITSDQLTGGMPIRFSQDNRPKADLMPSEVMRPRRAPGAWQVVGWDRLTQELESTAAKTVYIRCSIRWRPLGTTSAAAEQGPLILHPWIRRGWLNGNLLATAESGENDAAVGVETRGVVCSVAHSFGTDDPNTLILELEVPANFDQAPRSESPLAVWGSGDPQAMNQWGLNVSPGPTDHQPALPAKFGLPPSVYFEVSSE